MDDLMASTGFESTTSSPTDGDCPVPKLTQKKKKYRKYLPSPRRPSECPTLEISKHDTLAQQEMDRIMLMFEMRENRRTLAYYRKWERPLEQQHEDLIRRWLIILHMAYFVANGRNKIAKHKLNKLFIPKILLAAHRKRLAKKRARLLREYKFPSCDAHLLQKVPMLKDWPFAVLCGMAAQLKPNVFQKGDAVFHQGDIGDRMYYIAFGTVAVVIRTGKRRDRASGNCVATLGPGMVFGEFAVLVDEARTASIFCEEDVGVLYLEKKEMKRLIESLPSQVHDKMIEITTNRRIQNMGKLYKLTQQDVQRVPLFAEWNYEQISQLLECLVPCCFMKNQVIVQQGEFGDGMYFVGHGSCQVQFTKGPLTELDDLHDWTGEIPDELLSSTIRTNVVGNVVKGVVLKRGACFGEIGCLFLEARQASVVALESCDLWKIPKNLFISVLHKNPELFASLKKEVNITRAGRIEKCPHIYFTRSNLFNMLTKDMIQELLHKAKPRVYDYSLTIFQQNAPVEDLIVILNGKAKLYHRGREGKNAILGVYGPMSMWGEYEVACHNQTQWNCQLRAESRVDAYYISKSDFHQIASKYGDEFQKYLAETLRPMRPVKQGVYFPGLTPKFTQAEFAAMTDRKRQILEKYSVRKGIPLRDILPPVIRVFNVPSSRPSSNQSVRSSHSSSKDSGFIVSNRRKITEDRLLRSSQYLISVKDRPATPKHRFEEVPRAQTADSISVAASMEEEFDDPLPAPPATQEDAMFTLKNCLSACLASNGSAAFEPMISNCVEALSLPSLQGNILKASCGLPVTILNRRDVKQYSISI